MPGEKPTPITWKQLSAIFGGVLASLTLVAFLHAKVVVPSILSEVRIIIDQEIDKHGQKPHDGAIGNVQWSFIREDLAEIKALLSSLDERVRALEQKKN